MCIYIYIHVICMTNVCDDPPAQLQEYPLRQEHPPWQHLADVFACFKKREITQKNDITTM